ncbi:MAG TPA: sodium:solute symporter [Bryobacteraceae bacterium]|jgi:SSS family solute:Na+ symporter|nr:sodium:solute symporter [Bryobacteraceae bacterium]
MTTLDWAVLFAWLILLVGYGLWRGRGSNTVNQYLLAGKTMPWYAMGLSIMATQASAITFISTTAQAYTDGMRFVQFYFGLPIAMVILSQTAVPIFHRAKVYTAYEYLEKRFDAKTRALLTLIFLISRCTQSGVALAAPSIILSVILGWPFQLTTILMGGLVILYTASGGIKAVTWADVQQMAVIMASLVLALVVAIMLLPHDISFLDAVRLAGAAGKLNVIQTKFDWNDRYNLWTGLIGATFLMLAYFGTDQSQVQRYLTGRSIGQSRLSLLFNAVAKVPMQFFILFIGAMVFVLFVFVQPPLVFQPLDMQRLEKMREYPALQARHNQAFEQRREAARELKDARGPAARSAALAGFRSAQAQMDAAHREALKLTGENDTNYIFLSFVTRYLPRGIVGLVLGVIFTAAMSAISGEINSLATVTVVDVYRRHIRPDGTDRHYLMASRAATVLWGAYAIAFAAVFARGFGALIEAVNQVGSYFYGTMLGVFVLAFFVKRVNGNGAFFGAIAGEGAIVLASRFTSAYLWYNVAGCLVTILVALIVSGFSGPHRAGERDLSRSA